MAPFLIVQRRAMRALPLDEKPDARYLFMLMTLIVASFHFRIDSRFRPFSPSADS